MLRAFAIAALTCLPLPAVAQDMPLVDHVANMFLGLQAGYHVGKEGRIPILQLAPGVFEVTSDRTVKTAITEIEPCVFNYEATVGTRKPRSVELHMRKLNGVAYTPREPEANGMATIVVVTDAAGDYIIRDGKPIDAERFVPALETDIPVASLEASVAALKAACPAGDPNEGLELVDLLATAIFGFRHGYEFSLAGSYPVIRTSPGVYEIDMRADYKLSVSEIAPCLFEYTQQSGILMLPKMRVDATKLTSLAFSPTKTDRKQTTYAVTVVAQPGFRTQINTDGTTKPADDLPDTLETSVPLDLLEASVAAVLAACP